MFSIRVEQGHVWFGGIKLDTKAWYSLIVQKSGPDHQLLVNRDPYTVIENYMEQSLVLVYIDPFLTYLLVSVPSILTLR